MAQISKLKDEHNSLKKELTDIFDLCDPKDELALNRLNSDLLDLQASFQLKHDRLVHLQKDGPTWLTPLFAKQTVINSWLSLEEIEGIEIDAISVMSNHVHVILARKEEGETDFTKLLERHKRYTARRICGHFELELNRFWARGAFDRLVRRMHYGTVLWYVLNNPVKAGLTNDPLGWYGNYLSPRLRSHPW